APRPARRAARRRAAARAAGRRPPRASPPAADRRAPRAAAGATGGSPRRRRRPKPCPRGAPARSTARGAAARAGSRHRAGRRRAARRPGARTAGARGSRVSPPARILAKPGAGREAGGASTPGPGRRYLPRRLRMALHADLTRAIYPESRALVQAHRRRGHTLAIVSSATRYQIEPIARELGIPNVLCTRLEVQNGRLTGRHLWPTVYGGGKAMAARTLARERGI